MHVAANFWATSNGYGRPTWDVEKARMETVEKVSESKLGLSPIGYICRCLTHYMSQALFMGQLTYVGSIGLTRVSTAAFIEQLTRNLPQVRVAYILCIIAGIWTVASILVVALRGDLSQPWALLDGTQSLVCRCQLLILIYPYI